MIVEQEPIEEMTYEGGEELDEMLLKYIKMKKPKKKKCNQIIQNIMHYSMTTYFLS